MRQTWTSLFLIPLFMPLSGCLMETLTVTAIQGELAAENASAGARAMEQAKRVAGNTDLQRAIDAYRAEQGVNPPSLYALVPSYLDSVPTQPDGTPYPYDPSTGQLAAPSSPITAADRANMETIRQAINRYGKTTGYYPPTLDALAQYGYMPQVPLTSSGQSFLFNAQTGLLQHPAELYANNTPSAPRASQRRNRGGGVGGAGLMGETMTGIGIQQQLGNMNTSGTANVGSNARAGSRDVAGSHSDRQMKALRDLNLDR